MEDANIPSQHIHTHRAVWEVARTSLDTTAEVSSAPGGSGKQYISPYLKCPWEEWFCTIVPQGNTLKTTVLPLIDLSMAFNASFSNTSRISTKLGLWWHNTLQQPPLKTDSSIVEHILSRRSMYLVSPRGHSQVWTLKILSEDLMKHLFEIISSSSS